MDEWTFSLIDLHTVHPNHNRDMTGALSLFHALSANTTFYIDTLHISIINIITSTAKPCNTLRHVLDLLIYVDIHVA